MVSGFGEDSIFFGYVETISLLVTPELLKELRTGSIIFEVYGQVKSWLLHVWGRGEDPPERAVEANGSSNQANAGQGDRRSDEELVAEERHDVLAWIQFLELGQTGEYTPNTLVVNDPHDMGVFAMHQGLQRRVALTLTHSSGRQFQWKAVRSITLGHMRLQDSKGRITDAPMSSRDVRLNIMQDQSLDYNLDGTVCLYAEASWDSSLHGSNFLNRPTEQGCRILLNLSWTIEAERCSEPIHFMTDVAVQIDDRRAQRKIRTGGLRSLLGGTTTKLMDKCSRLFQVRLTPPITKNLSELWRSNTASTYVRGEEFLDGWRPRGVSMVTEYRRIAETLWRLESTENTRQYLALRDLLGVTLPERTPRGGDEATELCNKFTRLWRKFPYGKEDDFLICEEPPVPDAEPTTEVSSAERREEVKLTPQVTVMSRGETVSKKGYLNFPETNAKNVWSKRFFVIRRPYMYMYSNQSETDELGIINLSMVRVDHQPELERMLQKEHVFSLYTKNNAYMVQASSKQEMEDWIRQIDPWYHVLTQ